MSRPSETDRRYDRYAEIFDNPVDADSIERGNRVLHHEFMEAWSPREVVANRARRAQEEARGRAGRPARAADTRTQGRSR